MTTNFNDRIYQLALENLEQKKRAIDTEIAALRDRAGTTVKRRGRRPNLFGITQPTTKEKQPRAKRPMTEAHRQAIATAMKQRWAARHAAKAKIS